MGLEAIAAIALISYFIFLKDNQMPIFHVDVSRTGFSMKTLQVSADTPAEAASVALEVAGGEEFTEHTSQYDVAAVLDDQKQSVAHEETPPIRQVWFSVTGRVPGDDEDSMFIFHLPENTTRAALFDLFEEQIYEDEINAAEARDANIREHGQSVFINSIVSSVSEINEFAG